MSKPEGSHWATSQNQAGFRHNHLTSHKPQRPTEAYDTLKGLVDNPPKEGNYMSVHFDDLSEIMKYIELLENR